MIADDLRLYAPTLRARALGISSGIYREESALEELVARAVQGDLPVFAEELDGYCLSCAEPRARERERTLLFILAGMIGTT